MKVLQVNCVYRSGSTGKIVYDLHSAYQSRGIDSYVCYGRGTRVAEKNVYKTASEMISKGYNLISRVTGIQYGGAWGSTQYLINRIKKIKPDVVHLHCINGFFVNIYRLLDFLKKASIPTVLTLHAEFMYTGSCGYALECEQWKMPGGCKICPQLREATNSYFFDRTETAWKKMKKAFEDFPYLQIVSVSPWLECRARQSAIMEGMSHYCVLNGIDTENTFYYRAKSQLRKELGLEGKKVVLYVTAAFSEFKGANYILRLAEQMPDVIFLVVGNKENIGSHPDNLWPVGRVEDQKVLAEYYAMADVTVLTSKRETFSMICAESLSCGTPISLPQFSSFCMYGDLAQLEKLTEDALDNAAYRDKRLISQKAAQAYSKQQMCDGYISVYERLLDEYKRKET